MLFQDVRIAWRHRRLSRSERCQLLRRREAMAVRNAFGDLARILPLLVNPLPPPLGLLLIAIAYQCPRLMLSPQFHTAEQVASFCRIDSATQNEAATDLQVSLEEHVDLLNEAVRLTHFDEAERIRGLLSRFDTGPLSLEKLSRSALVGLARLVRPRSFATMHRYCCPNFALRRLIARAAADVEEDDALLLATFQPGARADLSTLSDTEISDACVLRALCSDEHPSNRIARWLDISAFFRTTWRRDLPPSFVFIYAALCQQMVGNERPASSVAAIGPSPSPTVTGVLVDILA